MGSIIAYSSDNITLEKATWDTVFGMFAEFRLDQTGNTSVANPFKRFTKGRKGKVGTRFGAVFTCADGTNLYEDEVMLKGWSDGTAGWKVTFWVESDDAGFHPFMNCSKGDAFAVALVELNDDNTAVDQDKKARLEDAKRGRKSPRLSNYAAQLCREPLFISYIGDRCGEQPSSEAHAEEFAGEWMRRTLKIGSRADLDTDREAATRFHKHVREPYNKWYRDRGHP